MKRRSVDDYLRDKAAKAATKTTPGDEERKERVLEHGRECLRRIKGDMTWEDWMGAGAAMMVVTEEAMGETGATVWDPNNRTLTRKFTELWEEYEASADDKSNQKPLSKQERWALREVMTNPQIGAWRNSLDGFRRRKLNHPNKVIETWKRSTQSTDREPGTKTKPSASLSSALKERDNVIAQQEERLKELAEELADAKQSAPVPPLDMGPGAEAQILELQEKLSDLRRLVRQLVDQVKHDDGISNALLASVEAMLADEPAAEPEPAKPKAAAKKPRRKSKSRVLAHSPLIGPMTVDED